MRLRRFVQTLALALVVLWATVPFVWMLLSSLQPLQNLIGVRPQVLNWSDMSLAAYAEVLTRHAFGRWFQNSVLVCMVVVLSNVVLDSAAAYSLTRISFVGRSVGFMLVLGCLMVPVQVILVPLYLFMRDLGLLGSYWALILPYLASPTGIFLMRQHFLTLPRELDEAARVDGASHLRTLTHVVLPNSKATLGTVAVLKFMWTWGEFAWPSLAVTDESMLTLTVGLARFQRQFVPEWNLLMAGAVMAVLPLIVAYALLQKWFVRGLTSGAVKG